MASLEIERIYAADLADHGLGLAYGTPEYFAMRERDRLRREAVGALVESGSGLDAVDFYRAAWVFNHGDAPEEARRGHELAMRAVETGHGAARWLAAAAYDRWQMYSGRPQRYGTQFVPDGTRIRLWDWDASTTDTERAAWDVPPLADQLARAERLTREDPHGPVGDEAPQWLKDAIVRWREEDAGR